MAARDEIADLLDKRGHDLRPDDIDEIRALLAQVPFDDYDDVAGGTWEAVALIVNDPAYEGDAKVPLLDDTVI